MQKVITDELDDLLDVLPPFIYQSILKQTLNNELLEIILDLGRPPEARYPQKEIVLDQQEITQADIEYIVSRIGHFSGDNRAGIERTLHRISAIRNREGKIVGLTCRVGRAIFGTVKIIKDLVESNKSVLLLGRPGIGKTTMLREVARVLADELKKRVIVVDTSNEIAGDGDIPHPAIGHARRMQVPSPNMQHAVMIEAVENHMPEVIIVDEIGTGLEAEAARTIAERGVQLIGTAHGNSIENLIMNPTLSDLIGGIQSVTLGDEEARRRRTQKSILERKAPPTFNIVVEIQERDRVIVHLDVATAVDSLLHSERQKAEIRWLDEQGEIHKGETVTSDTIRNTEQTSLNTNLQIFLFGVNKTRLEEAAKEKHYQIEITRELKQASILLTTKNYYLRKPQIIRDAEKIGIPIYAIKGNRLPQLKLCLDMLFSKERDSNTDKALREVKKSVNLTSSNQDSIKLNPQNAYIKRLQHVLATHYDVNSFNLGKSVKKHYL